MTARFYANIRISACQYSYALSMPAEALMMEAKIVCRINPVGSYVRTFEVPENWTGERTFIHFGGISSTAFVYLNGKYVGYTQGANNVAEFDITSYLKRGENRLAVQVFRWSDGSYLECQDMFRMSGIFRDVYLYNTPLVSVRDHYITASLDKQELTEMEP